MSLENFSPAKKFAVAALLASASADQLMSENEYKFMSYITRFGKQYRTVAEYRFRLALFENRIAEHEAHNSKEGATSSQGQNEFTDWTESELAKLMGHRTPVRQGADRLAVTYPHQFLKSSVDWRETGGVTYVKNQGHCGSCWTFATAAAMEHAHWRTTGDLVNLAESQFVDCDTAHNGGCNGGDVQLAYEYAEKNPVQLLEDYPYVAKDESCKYDSSKGKVAVTSYQNVQINSVEQLKAALNIGAAHVSVQADKPVFHQYTGGVITDAGCGTHHNHAITAIGYGSTSINGETVEYYIVKNSWGPGWGEEGYVRIGAVAGEGICGVQTNPTQPTTN